MERFFTVLKLGIKYLYRYKRRYYFLFAALIFGFTIISFITSTKDGMYDSVYYSAQSHYAGDIVAVGYDRNTNRNYIHYMGEKEINAVLNSAELSGINAQYTLLRTLSGAFFIHFNGLAVELKNLVGCDWENEEHLFNKMYFDEGPEADIGDDGIILSSPVAAQLGVKQGDSIILELETRFGQKNTGVFIVKGIVKDVSIFGYYKAYISRLTHNRLLHFEDNDCSSIGFFLEDPTAAEKDRLGLQELISAKIQTGQLAYDREGLYHFRDMPWEGNIVFLYTLPVYLSEIAYLLDAMNIITYFLYGMMLLTIFASAAVTYRLILHERSREMGVMRAIGFFARDMRLVLWTEIIVLGVISMLAGFFLARLLSWAVSFLSFSWFPGFEIFLKGDKLIAMYLPQTILVNAALLLSILVILALFPSFRILRKNLSGLLSGET